MLCYIEHILIEYYSVNVLHIKVIRESSTRQYD